MSLLLLLAGIVLVAGGVTVCLVELTRRWAIRRGWFDQPNGRSSHSVPTPALGGLALTPVILGGVCLWSLVLPDSVAGSRGVLLTVVAAAGVVGLVSFVDDLLPLPAALRLPTHLGAGLAIALVTGGITVVDGGRLGLVPVPSPWSLVLATLWVAWFINAFNFMDGIDGIAGGQAMVAGLAWIAVGASGPDPLLMGAGAILAGTAAGFLVHNWAPARIFMGDVGSAPLGLLLATVPWALGHADLWLASLLPLWPFLFDSLITLVRRASRGERLWEAHRSHLYQRLVVLGWSHGAVAALYTGLAAAGALGSVLLRQASPAVVSAWLGILALAGGVLWTAIAVAERKGAGEAASQPVRSRSDA